MAVIKGNDIFFILSCRSILCNALRKGGGRMMASFGTFLVSCFLGFRGPRLSGHPRSSRFLSGLKPFLTN